MVYTQTVALFNIYTYRVILYCTESEVAQSCPTLCNPMGLYPTRLLTQSMEFYRQEYWSGLPFPSPGDLPNLGIEPGSPALQADALPSEPPGKPYFIIDFTLQ